MIEYQKNDIVRLAESKFESVREQLWFKDNAFEIIAIKDDGMVSLMELDELVSENDLLPMPINKKHAGSVYYDPIIAASFVGPDDDVPVRSTDYSYFMEAFKKVSEEEGTTLYNRVEKQKYKYVHEVQHWLRESYGTDDLKIHHQIITVAEVQCRNLWNLRDGLLESGVSSYQFLYEMANMLYLRWLTFNDKKALERWKELELTTGDELIEKYQKAIEHIQQQTRIYSATVLAQALKEVSKCIKDENIAEVFDLMLQENSRTKASGAAQNYTPRVIAQVLVEVLQPKLGEYWYDPAAGFSGFLVEIDRYIRKETVDYSSLSEERKKFQLMEAISGLEIQKDVARIGFCNTRFHNLRCDIKIGDALTTTNYQLYDGIICEPPIQMFSLAGRRGEEGAYKNKQIEFVELILKSLSLHGNSRAAILLPENFLYRTASEYKYLRKRLFEQYNLHTVLRLPKGIYPNDSISMCAIFLNNRPSDSHPVLVYDMQAVRMKTEGADLALFKDFINTYKTREPQKGGQLITLDEIRQNDYSITFVKDNSQEEEKLETPSFYLTEANRMVREIRSLLKKLEMEVND